MCVKQDINKGNMDEILKELGKRFRKLNGKKTPAEIVLVGGAAIIASYGFRDLTSDMDAVISASSALKDAAAATGDVFGLENNWLNSDFRKTDSFSTQLVLHSKYYRTFSNVLQVRIVNGPYLLATKLVAGRVYKHDLPDIVGIMKEQKEMGEPITFDSVDRALRDLYGGWERVSEPMQRFFKNALSNNDLESLLNQVQQLEAEQRGKLLKSQQLQEEQPSFQINVDDSTSREQNHTEKQLKQSADKNKTDGFER